MRQHRWERVLFGVVVLVGLLGGAFMDAAQADEQVGNQVFFRGGYAVTTSDRAGEAFTDTFGLTTRNSGQNGYYVGGGLDLVLSKDVWGMMSKTWALGEVGVEFKQFNSKTVSVLVPTVGGALKVPGPSFPTQNKVRISMLTVDIAPKIKFLEGSRLRPWIIPIGLDFHVISPPSNATTVLDIGVQFGAGVEYHLFRAFHIGLDGRYHVSADKTQTSNSFGTVGAYLGISF